MKYNPDIHHRRSIRLRGYDYSQNGAYFITVCVHNRECLLGEIENEEIMLNNVGEMVQNEWKKIPERFPSVVLDVFVVMPNHFHGIFFICDEQEKNNINMLGVPLVGTQTGKIIINGETIRVSPTRKNTIGDIIGAFKSIITNQYIHGVKEGKFSPFEKYFWQRNYYEHIIRDERSLENIRNYIIQNPKKWKDDVLYKKF